jgi:radical SAM protein with 4Fe4S-binding SPASM domain
MFTSIAYPCVSEGCPAGVAQMHVRGNGDVCPCDFTPISFGNIRQKNLNDIWKVITEDKIYSKLSKTCRLSNKDFLRSISQR